MTVPKAVLLFEDHAALDLRPLTWTRPAFELRCGAFNLRERAALAFPQATMAATVRQPLRDVLAESLVNLSAAVGRGRVLILNARLRGSVADIRRLGELEVGSGVTIDGVVAAAHLTEAPANGDLAPDGLRSSPAAAGLKLLRQPWDLIHANGKDLCEDFRELSDGRSISHEIFGVVFEEDAPLKRWLGPIDFGSSERAMLYPGVHLMAEGNILFAPDARIDPGCVLDAENGPILVGPGAHVHANSTIVGPAYLGPGCVVNPGTRLREGTSLGAGCKVGGEVEEAVFLDLSNKQHDGFLGHAYVGSWVNLGAGTSASDLKNNYGEVKVDLGRGLVRTGNNFVGPMIGDHAKTGINTMLNTGSVVGVAANVFGGGFPPGFIPSFSWGGPGGLTEYRPDRALETARRVMARRGVRWTKAYEALLHHVFQETTSQR